MFDISEVIQKSFKLAWQNKILWVFALLVVSSGFRNSSNFGGSDSNADSKNENTSSIETEIEKFFDFDTDTNDTEETVPTSPTNDLENLEKRFEAIPKDVLGTASKITQNNAPYNAIKEKFLNTLPIYLVIAAPIFMFFVLFMFALKLIIKSWAMGAFITGINLSIFGETLDLRRLATYGRRTAREFVKYYILLSVVGFLVFIVLFLPVLLFIILSIPIAAVLFGLISFFLMLVYVILLKFIDAFAVRLIALSNYKFIDAIKSGFAMFKKNFTNAFLLAVLNVVISMALGVVTFIALIFVGGLGIGAVVAAVALPILFIPIVIVGVPLSILFIIVLSAFGAFMFSYKNHTWSFLFNLAMAEESKGGTNG